MDNYDVQKSFLQIGLLIFLVFGLIVTGYSIGIQTSRENTHHFFARMISDCIDKQWAEKYVKYNDPYIQCLIAVENEHYLQ